MGVCGGRGGRPEGRAHAGEGVGGYEGGRGTEPVCYCGGLREGSLALWEGRDCELWALLLLGLGG